jgi:outer membrane protein insertion porin family
VNQRTVVNATAVACVTSVMTLLLFCGGSSAQTAGPEIKALEIDAGEGVDATQVQSRIKIREGDRYTPAAVDTALQEIWRMGGVAMPVAETAPVEGGVKLIIHVRRLPVIDKIEFTGSLAIERTALYDALTKREGDSADESSFKADETALLGLYRKKGFPLATVKHSAQEQDGKWTVVYQVDSGQKLNIGEVRFEGNQAFDVKALRGILATRPTGLFTEGQFDETTFKADATTVADYYHARGYLDAQVGQRIEYDATGQTLFPVIVVREGSLFTVEQVVVAGNETIPLAELLAVLGTKQGNAFSEEQLDKDLKALRDKYGATGHAGADIRKHISYDAKAATVSIELEVGSEGPVYRIGRVDIRGNTVTKDNVIRRYVSLHPGDIADTTKVQAVQDRLVRTGLFTAETGPAGEAVVVYFVDTDEEGVKDLVVEVHDDVRGRVSVGAAWNSDIGPTGLIEVVHNNFDITDWPHDWQDFSQGTAFAGGGQQLLLRLQPGPDYYDYRVSWMNPSIKDTDLFGGFEVYATNRALEDYSVARTGANFRFGRKFMDDKLTLSIIPGIEEVDVHDIDGDAPPDAFKAKGTNSRHYLTLEAAFDQRDNPVDPSNGFYASASFTNVGGFLGGDVEAMEERIRADVFKTITDSPKWGKHVVHFGMQFGFMQGSDIPIFERFHAGGIGSLRGFEYDGIGPVQDGKQIGGEFLALGTAEYKFPIYGPAVQGVFFTDFGTLQKSISIADPRVAVGFGLRLNPFKNKGKGYSTPIGIDVAFPVMKSSSDDTQPVSFSVGGGFRF